MTGDDVDVRRVRQLVEDSLRESRSDLRGTGVSLLGLLADRPHVHVALFDHEIERVFVLTYDVLRLAGEFVPSDDVTVATEIAYGVLAAPERASMADADGVLRWPSRSVLGAALPEGLRTSD